MIKPDGRIVLSRPQAEPGIQGILMHREPKNVTDHVEENKLECGPMPNVMAALPNIGGALCSTPQRLADAHY